MLFLVEAFSSTDFKDLICTGYTPLAYDAVVFIAVVADLLMGCHRARKPDTHPQRQNPSYQ
eukprot:3060916-Amphidinium_carterae.1